MITIIDYGLGNIRAFQNVFRTLNISCRTARTPDELAGASRLILPGVGHFDHAMEQLSRSRMRERLDELVLGERLPVMGICVGMQMLADSSEEGVRPGLGWVSGKVRAFGAWPPSASLPMPHMGWNDVQPVGDDPLFRGLNEARFYFLHSFFFEPGRLEHAVAYAHYGDAFTCVVRAGNVMGVQFHPEKSHWYGARLLQNFADF